MGASMDPPTPNPTRAMSTTETQAPPSESAMALVELATGYWLPRCLHVVADIGVADALETEPRSVADLARALGVNADALDRVLRLLASHGIFERRDGKYAHNQLSRALRSDDPHSVRAYVRLVGLPIFWNSYGVLEGVIRTGKPAVNAIEPDGIFAYFKAHPGERDIFDGGMKSRAEAAIWPVLNAYDFSRFRTVADIGGGLGHLLKAILKATPTVKGILFDQRHVLGHVAPAERLEIQGGDFFRGPLPQCDAYILMEVIHDWADREARDILKQVRRAARTDARLLIAETVLPNDGERHFANHLDIQMMVVTGGRERTPDEFGRLFADCGFHLERVIPTDGPYSIVEGVAV
jgi:O-methyltransferase domain